MTKTYQTGDTVIGKVTGIQPYGAFVALDEQTQGLVHISEITHGYVKEVSEYLAVGQEVNVKVLEVDEKSKKISLSIRALQEQPPAPQKSEKPKQSLQSHVNENDSEGFNSLKDKMQEWINKSGQ
ncbi:MULTISPECIES: S1 domain-containing post-transcriptional regulator GSP13 [Planococcaceae]|uniref:S1 domain-containing post-transcriptional regulator GSP13 n=1 Tax=Planococcus shixiaomingii TaxID=3058393 RepID=A0ABT8N7S8_9BACL|nr:MULTISPECIES: S1 domain-containing post-transcriptional regulator GSP13 [Planococcaceae]MDN7243620.1 S1 domain-containing post-transcriptional regulator GSP13 [Planococcus sp. N028]TWT05886.1 general stress protein 13 [Planomicrobium sp. CPCC 101079]WKA56055.1 S1 domain-containing post-transcriptional regulator GSP13 [Planococcus sp. N022]